MIRRLKSYQILDKVGSGGMATVYRGRDINTGAQVALKVMHPFLAERADYVERFRREASLAVALDCPNIVRVLDYGEEQGAHFMALEFVKGRTVQQIIAEAHGPLPINQALDIAAQVCIALDAAYRHNVVHRDIKPHNIMMTEDGTVKVMDFGIARVVGMSGMTQTGAFIGSPQYMSPEQAQSKPVDIRSDIYSLGITLYQMLTGVVPFNAETPWAIMEQHVRRDPVPASRLRVDLPGSIDGVIKKALAKDAGRRYQTPAQMMEALQRLGVPRLSAQNSLSAETKLVGGQTPLPSSTPAGATPAPREGTPAPGSATPPPRAITGSGEVRRSMALPVAGGMLIVVAGIVVLGGNMFGGRAAPPATPVPVIAAVSPSSTLAPTATRPVASATPSAIPATATLPPATSTAAATTTRTATQAPPTATPAPTNTAVRVLAATATPPPPPTPTPARLAPPRLQGHGPGNGDGFTEQHGTVQFSWDPVFAMPAGAYYDLVLAFGRFGPQEQHIAVAGVTWNMPREYFNSSDGGRYDWYLLVRAADGTALSDPSERRWFTWRQTAASRPTR